MTTAEHDAIIAGYVMVMLSGRDAKILAKSDKMSEEMTKNNYTTVIAEIPNLPWRKRPEYAVFLVFSYGSEATGATLVKLAEKMLNEAKSQAGDRIVNVTLIVNQEDEPNGFTDIRAKHPLSILNFYAADHFLHEPMRNYIVPQQELADPADVKQFMDQYREDPASFPVMYISDPAAAWLGARVGDYIRIYRRSDTIGVEIMFRRCVERSYRP